MNTQPLPATSPWSVANSRNSADPSARKVVCDMLHTFINKEIALANLKTDTTNTLNSASPLPDQINWPLLERIAGRNGLIAILQSMIDPTCIATQRRDKWQRYSVQTLYNYTQAEKATANLFAILEKEGIPAVAMRGMALTQWVYSDPILRPMVDVDILVPAESRHDFVQKLKSHGLIPTRILRSQFIYEINNTKFEIHWSFLTPKRYRTAANFDHWLDTRQSFKTNSGTIYCFSPENELLDLVCHAFIHHELDTLLKLTDIALVAHRDNLDWDYITGWCTTASMTRQFALTLGVIDYLFGFNLLAHSPIKDALPAHPEKFYEAYAARFFQVDTVTNVFRRKQALLFVAEKYQVKLKQFVRLFSKDQLSELRKVAKLKSA